MAKGQDEGAARSPQERAARKQVAKKEFWDAVHAKPRSRRGLVFGIVAMVALAGGGLSGYFAWQKISVPAPKPVIAAAAAAPAPVAAGPRSSGPRHISGPATAVDGATLTVGVERVRLQGIESPPANFVCRTNQMEYGCGEMARRVLQGLAGGAPVDCVPAAALATAAAGTIATCRNDRGWDLASLQVETGWAVPTANQPVLYQAELSRAQANIAGLWEGGYGRPERWRASR